LVRLCAVYPVVFPRGHTVYTPGWFGLRAVYTLWFYAHYALVPVPGLHVWVAVCTAWLLVRCTRLVPARRTPGLFCRRIRTRYCAFAFTAAHHLRTTVYYRIPFVPVAHARTVRAYRTCVTRTRAGSHGYGLPLRAHTVAHYGFNLFYSALRFWVAARSSSLPCAVHCTRFPFCS